ncbi:MAG TPA: metalloregulator ArsR/SmtB family transcription factor [Planctomycetota bacterium]|nr:metalloregulator ArsR/SmtB family transcription factor [Planctomycetota bacterium]
MKVPPDVNCATLLKVLADDTRLDVVRQLMDGPRHVGELNASIPIDQSLLSHHLKILRESGIVTASRDGKAVLYRLAPSMEGRRKGKALNLGCCLISFE